MKLPQNPEPNITYFEDITDTIPYKVKYKFLYDVSLKAQGKTERTFENCCILFKNLRYYFQGIRREFSAGLMDYHFDLDWHSESSMLQPKLTAYYHASKQRRNLNVSEINCLGFFVRRNKAQRNEHDRGHASKINTFIAQDNLPKLNEFDYFFYANNKAETCSTKMKEYLSKDPGTFPNDESHFFSSHVLKRVKEGEFLSEGRKRYTDQMRRDIALKQKEFVNWMIVKEVSRNINQLISCVENQKVTQKNLTPPPPKKKVVCKEEAYAWKNCPLSQDNPVLVIAREGSTINKKSTHFCRIPVTCQSKTDGNNINLTASCGQEHCRLIEQKRQGNGNLSFDTIAQNCLRQAGYFSRQTKIIYNINPFDQARSRKTCTYDNSRTTYIAELVPADNAFCEVESCVHQTGCPKQTRVGICPYTHWNPKKPYDPSGCEQYLRDGAGCLNNNGVVVSKKGFIRAKLEKKTKTPKAKSE